MVDWTLRIYRVLMFVYTHRTYTFLRYVCERTAWWKQVLDFYVSGIEVMNRYRFSINANVSLVETGISPAADIFLRESSRHKNPRTGMGLLFAEKDSNRAEFYLKTWGKTRETHWKPEILIPLGNFAEFLRQTFPIRRVSNQNLQLVRSNFLCTPHILYVLYIELWYWTECILRIVIRTNIVNRKYAKDLKKEISIRC